jgi:hypothetical protein
MSIRFDEAGPPAGDEELRTLEERVGRPLPVSYRDFLEAHDGVTPEGNHLPDAAGDTEVAVRSFHSVEEVLQRLDALGPDRVPEEVVPISDDDYGNGLFVHLEDGSIWSWDPDREDPEELDLWAALTREAEDIDELLDRLEPDADHVDEDPEPLDEGYIDDESFRRGGGGVEPED